MKKIYFIRANETKFGGAENYLSRLLYELENKSIKYDVINSKIPKFLFSWFRVILFNFQICFNKKDKFYFSLERISCPDIYRAGDGVHKEFLKTKKRKLNPLNIVYLYLEKRCFENSKKIIANSKMIKNQIIHSYNINSSKIKVIYNGVAIKDLANFSDIKKEFGLKNQKIILFVGSGFERKGAKEFIQIISQLKSKNIHAFIIGKEKRKKKYKQLASSLQTNKLITFTGTRTDVDKFYSLADIFIFPTHYEPFSNVVLEAMNFKCVVFTTKQNGASEILNKDYIMQNPQDFSVVEKIDELLSDPEKMQKIKEENFKIVQNFTIERNAKETMEVIHEYIN
jgi:UDP-glucose:(heptosyl)LPS alpha-1,3-glucosyltransferase